MAIELQHISKKYGHQPAVTDISFSVQAGEIAGFIGPNGAGKSTTMKIICGLLEPDGGKVFINQQEAEGNQNWVRRSLGYLPENNPLYPEMYIGEYLSYVAGMYNLGSDRHGRIRRIIELTGLTPEKGKKIGALSKGYRQRLGIAQALLHDPSVLILDEPTSGLDPNQIIEIRNLIREIGKDKTVLLSTHILQEVEAICDRVIIINKGILVADSITRHLRGGDAQSVMSVWVEFSEDIQPEGLEKIEGVASVRKLKERTWLIQTREEKDIRPEIFNYAVMNNHVVLSMQLQEKKLEDVFRELTQ
jgi:ABC-2 type transport system ATP-binding protein